MTTKANAGRFKPGQSGNPSGKPPGVRNHATVIAEKILGEGIEAIAEVVATAAKGGDLAACRLVLDKILPARRGTRLSGIKIGPVVTPEDAARAADRVLEACASGEIDTAEASTLSDLIEGRRRTIELVDIERRLAQLEAGAGQGRKA